ncbi:MAG: RNA ligase family protein [Candidatus Bathyarchaeota archaeon]
MHIDNLYKNQDILLFKECYASEKIHGTSAHISWKDDKLHFFAGGTSHKVFIKLFNHEYLQTKFKELEHPKIVIHGEAYGGKCQGMSYTYGIENKFVVFEVCINNLWLDVPKAESVAKTLGLDFVPYIKCKTDIKVLDAIRDKPSEQAIKCGIIEPRKREGIVLRPLIEVTKNNGARIIAKHKALEFQETKTPRQVDSKKLALLEEAKAIADEWVTEMRLSHVLQNFLNANITQTGSIISAMVEDIEREAEGEVIKSTEARKEISKQTALMFKRRLVNSLKKK